MIHVNIFSYEGNEVREAIDNYIKEYPNYLKMEILREEIFLLGKERRHDTAIKKLLSNNEYELVEEYCASKTDNLLTTLFTEYIEIFKSLEESNPKKAEMLKRINLLLMKHATHEQLDSGYVLENMPEEWFLSQEGMLDFLSSSLSKSNYKRKNTRCKRQLSEIDIQNSGYKLSKAQKAWIKITERDKCVICNRKIGDKVFDVYPNGVFVDHTCMNKNSPFICPITNQDFSKTFNY